METLVNFRDVGGLVNRKGQAVVQGKIFRSGEITDLSAQDQQEFTQDLGIKRIFDFRTAQEVAERPDLIFPGVEFTNIDLMKDTSGPGASLEELAQANLTADDHMKGLYRDLVLNPAAQKGYHEFLHQLVKSDEPFIFHCFAGKDRTGLGAALILEILEVDREEILTDYLLTNELRQEANQVLLDELRAQGTSEARLAEINTLMSVKADYLMEAYHQIETHYGDMSAYLTNQLGMSAQDIAEFRRLYLK